MFIALNNNQSELKKKVSLALLSLVIKVYEALNHCTNKVGAFCQNKVISPFSEKKDQSNLKSATYTQIDRQPPKLPF